ncbi:PREDICTED: zinc finger CW-type PWWP domain protein 1 isoform X2 [Chinchilla lanigera]|uniref:zinc finger CW-type PWWP domain protein 1 isoform X2 n=1 Tax=Chinchilla lanigera TaxID=34839 RepID=UPI0006983C6D|nr:PREDICTED: zinc finger CW-type PWWP domain protein 1 isoform X2 [Chinchilla lanigera]
MATLQKEECGKGPKKTFAPPTQKLHSMLPCPPDLPKEALGIGSPEAEAKPSQPKLEKKKAATEKGPSLGREKKRKAQDSKPGEKNGKEKIILTNAEFEEIVQTVLRKSLQECLGMGSGLDFAETSCVKPTVCIQSDKEPGIVASATDNDNANGEKVMVPHAPEISAFLQDAVTPEMRASEPGQAIAAPSEKKLRRLYLSKRKKEAHEKMETPQHGHEHGQTNRREDVIQNRKRKSNGFSHCIVWVQCSSPNCRKWRRLCRNIDPSVLPDNWFCYQNTDVDYNCCDIPEEAWTGNESEVVYASYIPGSIIWAKQYGYPWWPGMVEADPDLEEYFLFASHFDSLPSKYHVTFFGETVSRAWIPANMLKNFQELSLEQTGVKKCRNKDYIQKLEVAVTMAYKARQTGIEERVNLFGFWNRYCGSDSNEEKRDLTLSGADSAEPNTAKEEEAFEMEEKEQKDPTLPGPKSAKIKTKNPKPKGWGDVGTVDGQDKIVKKKVTKRCLHSESTVPSVPIMERKEEQRNPDLDQPGSKKRFQVPQSKTPAVILPEEKEVRMVPKGLTPPPHHRALPLEGKERSTPQEPLIQEPGSVCLEDEASVGLDLEQIMEDIGRKSEGGGEL